jgi:hypothetical protein
VRHPSLHDEAAHAVFQAKGIEVQKQAAAVAAQPEIGENLGFVDRAEGFDGFDFYDHGFVYDEVGAVAGIELCIAIDDRDYGLPSVGNSAWSRSWQRQDS